MAKKTIFRNNSKSSKTWPKPSFLRRRLPSSRKPATPLSFSRQCRREPPSSRGRRPRRVEARRASKPRQQLQRMQLRIRQWCRRMKWIRAMPSLLRKIREKREVMPTHRSPTTGRRETTTWSPRRSGSKSSISSRAGSRSSRPPWWSMSTTPRRSTSSGSTSRRCATRVLKMNCPRSHRGIIGKRRRRKNHRIMWLCPLGMRMVIVHRRSFNRMIWW